MSCTLPSLLNLNDGTLDLDVNGHAMLSGSIGQVDISTGHGVIEYADGSAKRWVRFESRTWLFSGSGPAPSSLWTLDLTVATWTATFEDPEDIGAQIVVAVVPARPSRSAKNIETAARGWTLELREAAPR